MDRTTVHLNVSIPNHAIVSSPSDEVIQQNSRRKVESFDAQQIDRATRDLQCDPAGSGDPCTGASGIGHLTAHIAAESKFTVAVLRQRVEGLGVSFCHTGTSRSSSGVNGTTQSRGGTRADIEACIVSSDRRARIT